MKPLYPILTLIIAVSVGCGGGGGSNGHDRYVAGTWRGALTRTVDTCPNSNALQTLNFTHAVSQNGEAVTLVDDNGLTFLGNLVGGDGFSVDSIGPGIVKAISCSASLANRIEYNDIDADDDETASVNISVSCPGSAACEVQYTGTASRGVAVPTPTPGATPGPTPSTGSCADINPNPAAGTYSGDGGCGISDADFTVSGSTVILEPFGANGASSFAIDGDGSTATSNNADLTILGEAGYSCTITCSPPATFTLSCFKEGGSTCVEKF